MALEEATVNISYRNLSRRLQECDPVILHGDRDSVVEKSQRAPSLHYTGYIVQTVCQLSVGRALPCWGLSGWTGAQPPRVREVTTPRTVVYRREQMI